MTKHVPEVIMDVMPRAKCIVDTNVPHAQALRRRSGQLLEEQWTRGGQSGVTRYTYGDALLAHTTGGVSQYYQYDGLGSTRSLTDATGAVTDAYAYDAYGQLLAQTGASANPSLYRGERYDPDTEAYYLRARYYQPGIGRFLTTDPVEGFPNNLMSQHQYLYENNNPLAYLDPSGRTPLTDTLMAVGIIGNLVSVGGSYVFPSWANFLGDFLQGEVISSQRILVKMVHFKVNCYSTGVRNTKIVGCTRLRRRRPSGGTHWSASWRLSRGLT